MNSTSQNALISSEQLLAGLHPFFTADDDYLEDPEETLSKLDSIITLILGCQNDETGEFTIPLENVSWGLVAVRDLVTETRLRIEAKQEHTALVWKEMKNRLNACHLIPGTPKMQEFAETVKEVVPGKRC